jgi:hypothetical protein
MDGALLGMVTISSSGVHVDGALLSSRGRAEARENRVLVDAQALGGSINSPGAFASLILRVHSGLDLVTGVLQNHSIPTDRRLGEGRGSGGENHGQQRCRQHYLSQLDSSLLTRIDIC